MMTSAQSYIVTKVDTETGRETALATSNVDLVPDPEQDIKIEVTLIGIEITLIGIAGATRILFLRIGEE